MRLVIIWRKVKRVWLEIDIIIVNEVVEQNHSESSSDNIVIADTVGIGTGM